MRDSTLGNYKMPPLTGFVLQILSICKSNITLDRVLVRQLSKIPSLKPENITYYTAPYATINNPDRGAITLTSTGVVTGTPIGVTFLTQK